MKIKIIILRLVFVFIPAILFTEENLSAPDFFMDLRAKTLETLPEFFTGVLYSQAISKKMETIPKDSYLDKKKRPYVELKYNKATGISIEVKNVDDLYKDLYKDLPRQFFAFDLILSSFRNENLADRYDISYFSGKLPATVLKLNVKSAENTILLYIDSAKNQITRVDYLLGKELMSSTIIGYQQSGISGKYSIPVRFIARNYMNSKDPKPETIEIQNIK